MKLKDLEPGLVIEFQNKRKGLILQVEGETIVFLEGDEERFPTIIRKEKYITTLEAVEAKDYSIIKIYKVDYSGWKGIDKVVNIFSSKNLELLYMYIRSKEEEEKPVDPMSDLFGFLTNVFSQAGEGCSCKEEECCGQKEMEFVKECLKPRIIGNITIYGV